MVSQTKKLRQIEKLRKLKILALLSPTKIPRNREIAKIDNFALLSQIKIPRNIIDILKKQCPIKKGKYKVKDTHYLVFIPSQINETDLTIEYF